MKTKLFIESLDTSPKRLFFLFGKQFLAGLRDSEISDKVWDQEPFPDTFQTPKESVVKLTAKKDQRTQNRIVSSTLKKHGMVPPGIGNNPLSTSRGPSSKPEPMEVGTTCH